MREIALVFLKLSLTGFGGPNAHIAMMQAELVERRRWLDRDHFLHLLGITNLLPGPNSSEMAIHLGWLRGGAWGGVVAGVCFVLPTVILVSACAAAYFASGARPDLYGTLDGIKPAVVALIAVAGVRLARAAARDPVEIALAALGGATVLAMPRWELAAMAIGLAVGLVRSRIAPPSPPLASLAPFASLAPLAALAAGGKLAALLWLCFRTGLVLFGGGYLLVPLLHGAVVDRHAWLTENQFLDGIAITHSLPGPITSFVSFVGWRVAGAAGALGAAVAVYIPAFVAVLVVAPWIDRARRATRVAAALRGVNAVVAGTILGTAVSLSGPAIPGPFEGAIALVVAAACALRPALNVIVLVALAAAAGSIARALG